MRVSSWSLALLLCLTRVGVSAEFSADIVSRDADGAQLGASGKLYVTNGRVRIETPEAAAGFFLIAGNGALFVRPAQQIFADARQLSRLTRIFIPVDPNDPCPQWQAAARNAGGADGEWHCNRGGATLIDGRPATECRITSPDRDASRRWIDASIGFPIRVRMDDGTSLTLENIRIAAQSPELFAIPPAYRKLDPHALIERIKHSDVWVESPN
jgi:hypothetical protein